MSASQIDDLINPARLRLGIKRAFTGDIHEILSELFGNSQRAGARNVQITTDERGFSYQDDGRGLRDKSDFEALLKLGESGWDQSVEEDQQPMGLGIHSLSSPKIRAPFRHNRATAGALILLTVP